MLAGSCRGSTIRFEQISLRQDADKAIVVVEHAHAANLARGHKLCCVQSCLCDTDGIGSRSRITSLMVIIFG